MGFWFLGWDSGLLGNVSSKLWEQYGSNRAWNISWMNEFCNRYIVTHYMTICHCHIMSDNDLGVVLLRNFASRMLQWWFRSCLFLPRRLTVETQIAFGFGRAHVGLQRAGRDIENVHHYQAIEAFAEIGVDIEGD